MSDPPVIPDPFSPSEMRPAYEQVCEELRAVVTGGRERHQAAAAIVETGLRGAVAMTATAVQVMSGVGSLLVRPDGSLLNIGTLNAMLGQPPAYKGPAHKQARDWMAFWQNQGFHWQDLQWMEQAITEHRAAPVVEALIELFEWQIGLVSLLTGRTVADGLEDFITDWLAWEG